MSPQSKKKKTPEWRAASQVASQLCDGNLETISLQQHYGAPNVNPVNRGKSAARLVFEEGIAARRVAMASSLAAQLAQLAAKSRSSLDAKTLKASHSKSLIFEPRVAAGQTFPEIFQICREGFDELCRLDSRFIPFGSTLFSEQSQEVNRTQLSSVDNAALDKRIESFLHQSGSRLRLMPAIKAIEWLIRRFRYVFVDWVSPRYGADKV